MRIQAKQQFSHFHHGTFEGDEVRTVPDDVGEALVGMGLATDIAEAAQPPSEPAAAAAAPVAPAAATGRRRGAQAGAQ